MLRRAVRRTVPQWARRHARWLLDTRAALAISADLATFVRLQRLRRPGAAASGATPGVTTELRLRPLGGMPFRVRPGTADADVVWQTFVGRYHLPPAGLDPATILDLGANVGATVAHFAVLHPSARIVAVEVDPENAALLRANVAPWGDRCEVVEAAVWSEEGELAFDRAPGREDGVRVRDDGGGTGRAQAVTVASLLDRAGGTADYVKLDVEGAEREVLARASDWASRVGCLKVEVHAPYDLSAADADLAGAGFDVRRDDRHWSCLVATRGLSGGRKP